MFSDVKVLIWDFDGTFYDFRGVPELKREIHKGELQTIIDHTGWSRERTEAEYRKIKQKLIGGTATAAKLSGISIAEAAIYGEQFIDRRKYLHRDERLIALFESLKKYTHYLLVNGIQKATTQALMVLGLSPGMFKEIVTSETVGVNKPDPKGYQYILGKTGLPAEKHVMIGDRESVDLAPARRLGMKTCLVWSEKKSMIVDVTLSGVYQLTGLLRE